MIEIDPDDRAALSAGRKSSHKIGLIAAGGLIALVIIGISFLGGPITLWGKLNGQDRFADVYAALQTAPLPVSLQNRTEILPLLERLQKEHCDDKAAASLGDALATLNEKRAAARILAGFANECPRFNWLMYKAADNYYGLSDFAEARKVSDVLVSRWPEIAQFHFLAGEIAQGQDRHADAVAEFQNTIELTADRYSLTQAVFLETAKAYAQLGQFCKSAASLQQWISLDSAKRDNSSSQAQVTNYLGQGHCADYAEGTDSFPRADKTVTIVQASIGGATGRFIIDTGAAMVTLTADFARKAGLSGERAALLKTANGTRPARIGTAAAIKVGRLRASDIATAILPDDGEKLGPDVDGLLGMSFLSRFRVEISSSAITLSPRR